MGNRRLALIVGASLCVSSLVFAQPDEEVEIEMEETPVSSDTDSAAGDGEPAATDEAEAPPAPVKDPKLAKKWRRAGDQLVRKGDYLSRKGKTDDAVQHYQNAVTAYQKALEAGEDASLYYQLALVEEKAGLTVDAIKHLKVVLAAEGIKPNITKSAQARLDELLMKVGIVTLTVSPDGAQVELEGKELGETPLPEPLILEPGTYKLTFSAVGYQPKDFDLKVEAGSESERSISLEPVPIVAQAEPDEPMPEPSPAPPPPSKLPLYIGGGAAIGFTIAATVTGIVAIGKHGTYTDAAVSPTERADARSSGKTFALVTDIAIVGAVGAAAFTAYWYQFKYRPGARARAERQEQAKVDVRPWVQPQAGGLSVAGTF